MSGEVEGEREKEGERKNRGERERGVNDRGGRRGERRGGGGRGLERLMKMVKGKS